MSLPAKLYTTRHNQAVYIVLKALLCGKLGGAVVQADTSASQRADLLLTSRLPRSVPASVLGRSRISLPSRPDITLYSPSTRSQRGFIYLVELKYSMEHTLPTSYDTATRQHQHSVSLLRSLRPDCDVRLVPIHLGATGGVYSHLTLDSLTLLGLSGSVLSNAARHLHRHSILWLYSLLTKYQRVRFRPSTGRLTRIKLLQTSGVT